jgi:hypothetical protein
MRERDDPALRGQLADREHDGRIDAAQWSLAASGGAWASAASMASRRRASNRRDAYAEQCER